MKISVSLAILIQTLAKPAVDAKDLQIQEHVRKAEALEEACIDLEGTITQFRDLVVQLQGYGLPTFLHLLFIFYS